MTFHLPPDSGMGEGKGMYGRTNFLQVVSRKVSPVLDSETNRVINSRRFSRSSTTVLMTARSLVPLGVIMGVIDVED